MRKTKVPSFRFLAFALAISSLSVYADQKDCPKDAVHCAYITGISGGSNQGRWIKLVQIRKKKTSVLCLNDQSTISISQGNASSYKGLNLDVYSICTDSTGNKCTEVIDDNFNVRFNIDKYDALPPISSVNLSQVKDKFPACTSVNKSILD